LTGAEVVGTVIEQGRGDKIRVFKYKKRKHYRRTRGHRQSFTAVRIDALKA
jgi:large subunit ribosomal protein L21